MVAYSRASLRISSTEMPVIDATRWRILLRAGFKLVVAQRVFVDVVVIHQVLGDDHVHHAQRQGPVCSRADLDMPVGLLGGTSADRVDDHDFSTILLCLEDEGPGVQVRAQHVHRPDDDVFRIGEAFHVEPAGRATVMIQAVENTNSQ